MSASSTQGGGFLIGMLYGLIASTVLFLVLVFMFPLKINVAPMGSAEMAPVENAPEVMETAGADPIAQIGEGPVGAEFSAPMMAQPDAGENNNTTVGGAGDTGPVSATGTQIADNSVINEPAVTTEAASVPDIGNGTSASAAPGSEATAPTPPAEGAESAPVAVAPTELVNSGSGPAIDVFAASFSGDFSKPLLAIVLEDTLETSLQPLIDTGKPFTFALPAGVDSSISAQSIRESGFEVVAMIPRDVTAPQLTPEALAQYMQNVPVAVAILDADNSALMLKRDSMQVILDATSPSGLGLISYSRNGELIARAQAQEAGAIFGSALQITDEFNDEELIIQALNQAAFVAGTNDRAIIFAKTTPETINGIVRWLNSPRAMQLELVPVSVALRPAN